MTEQTLTRNESADLIQRVWATLVEGAPKTTQEIRESHAATYILKALLEYPCSPHGDHCDWLLRALSDAKTLDLVDGLAEHARLAGGELAAPWRDESETQ